MFTSSTGNSLIKQEIGHLLRQNGFQPFKAATYYKITSEDILQFLYFQKGVGSRQDQMTINAVIQSLFSPTCSLSVLQPGGSIGQFLTSQRNKMWYCNEENATTESINNIKEELRTALLPDLHQKLYSPELLIDTFHSPTHGFLWHGQNTFIDQGYICLKAKRHNQGLTIFKVNRPSKVNKFKTIQNWINQEQWNLIDDLLQENIRLNREKWKI